jgi:hypothetical protein
MQTLEKYVCIMLHAGQQVNPTGTAYSNPAGQAAHRAEGLDFWFTYVLACFIMIDRHLYGIMTRDWIRKLTLKNCCIAKLIS